MYDSLHESNIILSLINANVRREGQRKKGKVTLFFICLLSLFYHTLVIRNNHLKFWFCSEKNITEWVW